jgi:hypothetical protein
MQMMTIATTCMAFTSMTASIFGEISPFLILLIISCLTAVQWEVGTNTPAAGFESVLRQSLDNNLLFPRSVRGSGIKVCAGLTMLSMFL